MKKTEASNEHDSQKSKTLDQAVDDLPVRFRGGLVACRVCRCTEREPCLAGCAWVHQDLCSVCCGAIDELLIWWLDCRRRPSWAALVREFRRQLVDFRDGLYISAADVDNVSWAVSDFTKPEPSNRDTRLSTREEVPLRWRRNLKPGTPICGRTPDYLYGFYFPTTDMNVSEGAGLGTGKPPDAPNFEWLDDVPASPTVVPIDSEKAGPK